ncbi:MAG: hypothetical protein DMD79_26900 [Candidatus Rokuibacteriota bacterium]|nr:MAG: hypothetical protein DMD79_26900 [Candidatus Rokubacteria bacterium]
MAPAMTWQAYHTVWALIVFGWIGNYMVRMAFSPLLEAVRTEFGLSHAEAGFVFSIFFYGYLAMQVPAGLLGDRFGRKRVLVTGILTVAAGALLTGLASTLLVLGLARLLTGLAQGMYFANDRPIVAAATPPGRLAVGQGVSFSGLGLGTALGLVVGGLLGEVMPWRRVFMVLILFPLLSAVLIGRFVPEPPGSGRRGGGRAADQRAGGTGRPESRAARAAIEPGMALVFRSRALWLLGLAGMAPIWTQWLIGTWGPALFAEVGVAHVRQALYARLLGLHRKGFGRQLVFMGAILSVAILVALTGLTVQLRGPAWLLAVLVFATSFFVWGAWAPGQAMVAELFPPRVMGVAFGLLNATAFVASLLAPPITGWIKDATGSFAGGCYLAAAVGLLGVPLALAVRSAPAAP